MENDVVNLSEGLRNECCGCLLCRNFVCACVRASVCALVERVDTMYV